MSTEATKVREIIAVLKKHQIKEKKILDNAIGDLHDPKYDGFAGQRFNIINMQKDFHAWCDKD